MKIKLNISTNFRIYKWSIIYSSSRTTVVEGDPKAPFSIATTLKCRGRGYSFPWIAPLNLDQYLIMLSVKQVGVKYHFLSLWHDLAWDWTLVSQVIGEH